MSSKASDRSVIVIFIIFGLVILITVIYALMSNSAGEGEQLLGDDQDEHGCIASAGYSWCEAKEKCLRTWEEECPVDSSSLESEYLTLLKSVIIEKYPEIEISDINNDSFNWTLNDNGMLLSESKIGLALKLKNISRTVIEDIKTELLASSFVVDGNNMVLGGVIELSGYFRENLLCLLEEEAMNSELSDDLFRLNIYCALNK